MWRRLLLEVGATSSHQASGTRRNGFGDRGEILMDSFVVGVIIVEVQVVAG